MTSKERILKTIRGEKTDRIPIFPCLVCKRTIHGYGNRWGDFKDDWREKDSNYMELLELVKQNCDYAQRYEFPPHLDRRFFLLPYDRITLGEIEERNGRLRRSYTLNTRKGDLVYIAEKEKGVDSIWTKKPLIESKEDVQKLLSVPYVLRKPDIEDFLEHKRRIEEEGGLLKVWISTPLIRVSQLLSLERFLLRWALDKPTIKYLVKVAFERVYEILQYLLENGVGPVFEFGGSEQATPPMMSGKDYDELVVKYDSQLIDLIHNYGGYACVHSHGKVGTVLKKMIDMGADSTEPVEPPPSGDIEIGEAKRIAKDKMTIMGNIELDDFEHCTPKEIDEKVKHAIYSGGRERFILSASTEPITFISDKQKKNYIQFIESGLKYGQF